MVKEVKIYFDLEGKLYKEKEVIYTQEQEQSKKERESIPEYELVRKENTDNGYSAIVYINQDNLKDYSIVNTVKDIRAKNDIPKAISILFFIKNDKVEVENALESTENKSAFKTISDKTRANYEKNDQVEELFYFPSGLSGEKLALEIK